IQVTNGEIDLTHTIFDQKSINGVDSFSIKASSYGKINIIKVYYLNNLIMKFGEDVDNDFSISEPIITSLSKSSGFYNDVVTIYGNNFYNGETKVYFSEKECQTVEWVSNKEIIVTAPHGYLYAIVKVQVGDSTNDEEFKFNYGVPTIDKVIYHPQINTSVTDYIDNFVIVGRNLGSYINEQPDIYILDSVITCDSYFCSEDEFDTEDEENQSNICSHLKKIGYQHYNELIDIFYCSFDSFIGKNLTIDIEIIDGTQVSNKTYLYSYFEPYVESMSLNQSNTDGGLNITIDGYNFPPFETLSPYYDNSDITWLEESNVTIGSNYTCALTEFFNSTQLNCTIPPGIGANHTIVVFVGQQNSSLVSQEYLFSYNPPALNISSDKESEDKVYYRAPTNGTVQFIINECNYNKETNTLTAKNNEHQFIFCSNGDDYNHKFEFNQNVICNKRYDPETSLESIGCSMEQNPDYVMFFDRSVRCYIDDKTSCFMNISSSSN
ncbi:hypothetical protein DICPUDRAFT_36081, partial [Dictyostelium purpureum]